MNLRHVTFVSCNVTYIPYRKVQWKIIGNVWNMSRIDAVRSRGAAGQQNGNAIDDGVAAPTAIAAHEFRIQREGLPADRSGEPTEGLGCEGGHKERVLGSRFEVRGWRKRQLRRF